MEANRTDVSPWAEPASASERGATVSPLGIPRWLLYTTSFFGGFQIMALEICGLRVLQTNLGSSVVVTGTLLTIVMILLAVGYYTGGRLSAKYQSTRVLFALLAVSSVYTALVAALLLEPIASIGVAIRSALIDSPYLHSGVPAAVLTLLLYGLPMFLMSMISPYWIRLQSVSAARGETDPGMVSGFFMSLSTVGSIVGTMLASYVLTPLVGVAMTGLSTSLLFLGIALLGYFRAGPTPGAYAAKALSVLGALTLVIVGARALVPTHDPSIIYEAETLYGEIRIEKTVDDEGRNLLAYHPSRVYTHSILYPDEPLRDLEGLMYLVPGMVRAPKKVLVLGSAVGGVMRGLEVAFPDAHTVGVDIDPVVHEVATELFGVKPERARLVSADARVFLEEDRDRYDLIVVDLFAGEFIPTHCITKEFFGLVQKRLAPGGGVFINTNMNDVHHELADSEPARPVRNLQATVRAAGFQGLFENSFFHSLFAFREPLAIEALRAPLLATMDRRELPLALRTGAGIAAFTTVAVPSDRRAYRPYTDAWSPALHVELKSNTGNLYEALDQTDGPARDAVAAVVLGEELRGFEGGEDVGLRSLDALLGRLDSAAALPKPGIDLAAKYFRFSAESEPPKTAPTSDWGKLATLYAEVTRRGGHNDYEGIYPVLEQLRAYL
ncbi:MAG: fused MFS/spermidine synthase [Polyangiales bacterium]